ncbi:MAG TPA: response regulator [Polyangiales bacterium]|nr:response regulator [Polyangiales bacterium]
MLDTLVFTRHGGELMGTSDETDILYVEDNLDHAELVLRCLERFGVRDRVIHVEDGERALAVLEAVKANTAVRPRLILLDLRLPGVAGMEILQLVKSTPELRDIPVIILTTSASPRDMQDAYANYVNSYLVKPDDLPALSALMTDLSTYWLGRNQTLASEHSL